MEHRTGRVLNPAWNWRDCQSGPSAAWPREEPNDPRVGQGWYDEREGLLRVWDGQEWVCAPRD